MTTELAISIIIVSIILGIDQGIEYGDIGGAVVTHFFVALGITHFISLLEKMT